MIRFILLTLFSFPALVVSCDYIHPDPVIVYPLQYKPKDLFLIEGEVTRVETDPL